jgi:hypothetical protein
LITMIKDWSLVYLFGKPDGTDMDKRWGRVVVGEVFIDASQTLRPGEYICTDPIARSPGNFVHTHSGKSYTLYGEGRTVELAARHIDAIRKRNCLDEILLEQKKGRPSDPS